MDSIFNSKTQDLPQSANLRRVFRGQSIFEPGDEASHIYFVVEGKVKISAINEEDQKEVTKGIFGSGDLFGEQVIIGNALRRDRAVALQNTTLRMISCSEMWMLLQGRADLTLMLMQLIATRQQEMEYRLESLVFRDSRSRVIECLVQLIVKKGKQVGYEWVLRNPITHKEIANLAATSRQTVTTTLNDLRYDKILTFNRERLIVRNLEKLKSYIKY